MNILKEGSIIIAMRGKVKRGGVERVKGDYSGKS